MQGCWLPAVIFEKQMLTGLMAHCVCLAERTQLTSELTVV